MEGTGQLTAAIGALAVAGLVAFVATPMTGRLALRFGILDHPSQDASGHKRHSTPTPYLGGVALFLGLVAGSLLVFAAAEGIPIRNFLLTIGAGLALGLVGLADDIKPLPRAFRLASQILVALAAWKLGFGVDTGRGEVLDILLSMLWIVGITNAFNLLDNMDGVSAGLAGIAAASFATMGLLNDLPVLPTVAAALAGASFGFLAHNRHPAKVFMGDAGSLFLGFLVALLAVRLRFDRPPEVTFLVPVIALGIPILDTTLVVLSRIRHHQPVFLGARDHVTHRLVGMGLSIKTAVGVLYWAAICLAWIALAISRATSDVAIMLTGFVIAMGMFLGGVLWKVPVYDRDT